MPVGISPANITGTLKTAAETAKTQARAWTPRIKGGVDELGGRLAQNKAYQKGKNAFQKAISHPFVEKFLQHAAELLNKLSQTVSKWADGIGARRKPAAEQAVAEGNSIPHADIQASAEQH